MALRIPPHQSSHLFKEGHYSISCGINEVVLKNIEAVEELSNLCSTSYGPFGRSKIIINHLGFNFITKNVNLVLSETDVLHPAAKLVLFNAQNQFSRFADCVNFCILLSNELLQNAKLMIIDGLNINQIVEGYELALLHINKQLDELSIDYGQDTNLLKHLIMTAVGTKCTELKELVTDLVLDAVKGLEVIIPDNIRVVKIMGSHIHSSKVLDGMVFNTNPLSRLKKLEERKEGYKVAIYSCPIDSQKTETKGTVLIKNNTEMLNFSKEEEKIIEETIKEVKESGVHAIICMGNIGDIALHFIDKYELLALRVASKFDLRRIAKCLNATILTRLGTPTKEEIGECSSAKLVEIGGDMCTVIKALDTKAPEIKTIILRGATKSYLDEIELAIRCGLNTAKNSKNNNTKYIYGAGCVEMQINNRINKIINSTIKCQDSSLQYPLRKASLAFEGIPRLLALNSGFEHYESMAKVRAAHYSKLNENMECTMGVDVESDKIQLIDSKENNIIELLSPKKSAIELAFDAAISVLQVDQIIMSKRAGGPKPPQQNNPNWDED